MTTINLRDFYPWYTHDKFVEVSDEIADELFTDKRYQRAHRRRVYRNKAQYSLDAGKRDCRYERRGRFPRTNETHFRLSQ